MRTDDEIQTMLHEAIEDGRRGHLSTLACAEILEHLQGLLVERDATLAALNERRDRLIAVAIEMDTLRAERDAALAEVKRLRGLIVTGGYPPNTGAFAPLVPTEETEA